MVSTDVAQLVRRRTVKAWSMSIGKTVGSKLAGGQGSEPGQQDSHLIGQGLYTVKIYVCCISSGTLE